MKIRYILSILIVEALIMLPTSSFAVSIGDSQTFDLKTEQSAIDQFTNIDCPDAKGWAKQTSLTDGILTLLCTSMDELEEVVVTGINCKGGKMQTNADGTQTCVCPAGKVQEAGKGCVCKGIKLNTDVPFIGNCISFKKAGEAGEVAGSSTTSVNAIEAFPRLMGALMNIVMTAALIIGFLMIVFSGVMMTTEGVSAGNYKEGLKIIKNVGVILALIGLSGVILKLINPAFFS